MNRGSEWIRVDLHIHTKGTKKNDKFESKDMDEFFELFFEKAFEKNIKIIGITDYFNIDNYKSAKKYLENLKADKNLSEDKRTFFENLLLIPNVELRASPSVIKGGLINIHCLFSPHIIEDLEENFFNELKCSDFKMTKKGIIELGKKHLKGNFDDEQYYKKGIEVFFIDIEKLKKIKEKFRDNILIGVSNSSKDGIPAIKGHDEICSANSGSSEEVKRQFYKISDFIFSGNPKDREFFLGEKTSVDDVKEKYGGIKPCFHGSDAHNEDKLFNPDKDRNCWIKSEISFEGIKQVIQEPEDRVIVQKGKPEEKKAYNIIDYVSFKDENTDEIKVYFNQNLNTIIGGKSTGKSLLLKNIVNYIDEVQIEEKLSNKGILQLKDFKVFWRNREENKNIEYIPQTYLNRLLDEENKETSIDEIVKKIMLQDNKIKEEIEEFNKTIKEEEDNINKLVKEYFQNKEEFQKIESSLKELGVKESIEKEIKELKNKIEKLQKESGIEKEEIENLSRLEKEIGEFSRENLDNTQKITELKDLDKNFNLFNKEYIERVKKLKLEKIDLTINEIEKKIREILQTEINQLEKEVELVRKKIEEVSSKKQEYDEKIKNQKEIEKIKNILNVENRKLKEINDLEERKKEFKENIESKNKEILDRFGKYEDNHISILSKERFKKNFETLEIEITYKLSKDYWNNIYTCLNGTSLRSYEDYKEETIPDMKNLKKLYSYILEEKIKLKKDFKNENKEEVLKRLVKNPFILKYEIKENGNNIDEMSEGNKSFVLLELIINLNDSKFPIIIDQPEDDLDNRSIYEGLVKFLKEKKKKRQIIVATHNANVVVGADAENVIIANQDGIKTKNMNGRKFDYKNGGLENKVKKGETILENKDIQEHVCEILEGGKEAFELRKNKYKF